MKKIILNVMMLVLIFSAIAEGLQNNQSQGNSGVSIGYGLDGRTVSKEEFLAHVEKRVKEEENKYNDFVVNAKRIGVGEYVLPDGTGYGFRDSETGEPSDMGLEEWRESIERQKRGIELIKQRDDNGFFPIEGSRKDVDATWGHLQNDPNGTVRGFPVVNARALMTVRETPRVIDFSGARMGEHRKGKDMVNTDKSEEKVQEVKATIGTTEIVNEGLKEENNNRSVKKRITPTLVSYEAIY